uniref:Uncharacterized protein n=1 Tax=Solanum tuberosum TaxID=4113 RepID=M1B3S8_SOLTU
MAISGGLQHISLPSINHSFPLVNFTSLPSSLLNRNRPQKPPTTVAATTENVENVKDHQIWDHYPLNPMVVRLEPPSHHSFFQINLKNG